MNCVECRHLNPEENVYCGKCGAELGLTIAETIAKRGIRDRKAIEYELTENVADRLKKWSTIAVALFALALGWTYLNFRTVTTAATKQVDQAVKDAEVDIASLRKSADDIKPEVAQIRTDVEGYRETNSKISKLQSDLLTVQKSVVDLGKRDFKANSLQSTGPGPSRVEFGSPGCPSTVSSGMVVDYCTKDSPLTLYQLTESGDLKPVASRSPIGFQEASTAPKPSCETKTRGMLYVEKGGKDQADHAFVCGKKSNEQFEWILLGPQ
jgi:hypothetical protein